MKIIAIFLMLGILSACGQGSNEEADRSLGGLSSGDAVIWTSGVSSGIDLRVSNTLSGSFGTNSIVNMMNVWNGISSNQTFFQTNFGTTSDKNYSTKEEYNEDNEFGIYYASRWFSDVSNQTLAITQYKYEVRKRGNTKYGALIHADIVFNGNQIFTSGSSGRGYDFQSVLLHELGHFIGLPHVEGVSSVMFPSIGRGSIVRDITNYDQDIVFQRYNSGLSSSVAASRSIASFSSVDSGEEEALGVVSGTIELRKNGECHHYLDGKLVHKHKD